MTDQSDNNNKEHVTIREFDGFKEAVVDAIARSDENINKRFDLMERRFDSGQKTTNELLRIAGAQGTRIDEHERRLNSGTHKHSRKDDAAPSGDNEPLTIRHLKNALLIATVSVIVAVGGVVIVITMILDKKP